MDLKPNTLSLIGLCREYCTTIEGVETISAPEFLASMVRLLPRIYITATDLERQVTMSGDDEGGLDNYLEEDYYEALRLKLENLFGPDDVYLEVFEEEMKYSDTPIGVSVAEGLCDLFQVFYNFVEAIKGSIDNELMAMAINAMRDEFETTWSQQLVNVMRPLNALVHKNIDEEY
ncbi:MAG: DUF5063 domain-containing protein [Muribaculaceae bacterium]|nr:DUF5063 domain-containing protein [Muribaculaceae bacterium]